MEVVFNNNGQPELITRDLASEFATYLGPLGLWLSSEEGTKFKVICDDDGIQLRLIDRYGTIHSALTKDALYFNNTTTKVPQVFLGLIEDQAVLVFYDSSGELIWGAP
jgi:hypothetical protein